MAEIFIDVLEQIPRGLVYVAMGVVVMAIARVAQDLTTPYKIQEQLNHKDNVALALSISGYYFGVIIVFLGALYQPFAVVIDDSLGFTTAYWQDVGLVFVYSVVGILVLNVARIVVDRLVLYDFSTVDEIVTDHNAGTGAVEFAVYVAVGLVIAGSISGEGGGPETAAAFLVMGLAALIIYTLFYEWTTSFDIHDEIEKGQRGGRRRAGGQSDSDRHSRLQGRLRRIRELEREYHRLSGVRGDRLHPSLRDPVPG